MARGVGSDMKVFDHGQLESKEWNRDRHEIRRNSYWRPLRARNWGK